MTPSMPRALLRARQLGALRLVAGSEAPGAVSYTELLIPVLRELCPANELAPRVASPRRLMTNSGESWHAGHRLGDAYGGQAIPCSAGLAASGYRTVRRFAKGKNKGKQKPSKDEGDEEPVGEFSYDELHVQLQQCLESLGQELGKMRSGRATPGMLDHLEVDAYETKMALNALASATVRSSQLLVLTPYDPQVKDNIAKAIHAANLGVSPQVEGEEILIVVPPMNQDTKSTLVKAIKKVGENAKWLDLVKLEEKVRPLDECKRLSKEVEKFVEDAVKVVSTMEEDKVREIQAAT